MNNDLEHVVFNAGTSAEERLDALKKLCENEHLDTGVETDGYVNNHIHTIFSFSPYTPCAALYSAKKAGLRTAGIMDHDSIGGAEEFIAGGKILSMPVTVGCELRVSVNGTSFAEKRLNNPDQLGCAYVALHGIPHQNLKILESVLSEKREKRNERNRKMCGKINALCKKFAIHLDFEDDVIPLSQYARGGSITERHVLFSLVIKICEKFKSREEQLKAIEKLSGKDFSHSKYVSLLESPDEFYMYDLLGVLKSGLIEKIYIPADDELLNISEYIMLAKEIGAISAYAYLGDVGESPTGDKKAQKFEDDYIDLLFEELHDLGFNAITYMPSRNTSDQLHRVIDLCDKYGFFQISGEDINSPRQSFICPALEKPEYSHLKIATYALIGHEKAATECFENGMFFDSEKSLEEKIKIYAGFGGYSVK